MNGSRFWWQTSANSCFTRKANASIRFASAGTWYSVRLTVSAAGLLGAYKGTTLLGTYTPTTTLANGYAGFGTQSATAAFDNIVVTQP